MMMKSAGQAKGNKTPRAQSHPESTLLAIGRYAIKGIKNMQHQLHIIEGLSMLRYPSSLHSEGCSGHVKDTMHRSKKKYATGGQPRQRSRHLLIIIQIGPPK